MIMMARAVPVQVGVISRGPLQQLDCSIQNQIPEN